MILFFPLDIEYTFTALTALIAESNPKDKDKYYYFYIQNENNFMECEWYSGGA